MTNHSLKIIKDFCTARNISKIHERILFHKYNEDYLKFINEYTEKEKVNPTPEVEKAYESLLLSENTLTTNLKLAEEEINDYIKGKIRGIKKEQSIKEFGISILSSIIASVIFTLILVLVFSLGRSQIKSWINDMYESDKQIEEKVNNVNN